MGISDGACGVYIKRVCDPEEMGLVKNLKPGAHIAVFGKVRLDKFDNEPFLYPRGIKKIAKKDRRDDAEEKRV